MKKVYRITEGELRNMVMESVRRAMMNEGFGDVASAGFSPEAGEDEYEEMNSLRGGDEELDPETEAQVEEIVDRLNAEFGEGEGDDEDWFSQGE